MTKHRIRTALLTIILLMPLAAAAQENLSIGPLFGNEHGLTGEIRTVYLSGDDLDGKKLSLFRSLQTEGSEADVAKMGDAAEADSKKAKDVKRVKSGDRLMALYMELPPVNAGADNRFILFRRTGEDTAMLIYMEGKTSLPTIVNLKKK